MYHSKQKSPTAFSSETLLGFKMRSTRLAQQWLFPLEISKQVTQNISPHQGTDGPERPCPAAPGLPQSAHGPGPHFRPLGPTVPAPVMGPAGPVSSSPQPYPVPAVGPTEPLVGPHPSPASAHAQGDVQPGGWGCHRCPPPAALLLAGSVEWEPQLQAP